MFTRGDHVVITANDARRGQTGTVVGEKTAVDDLWVMVEINGEIEFYEPGDLKLETPARKSLWHTAIDELYGKR